MIGRVIGFVLTGGEAVADLLGPGLEHPLRGATLGGAAGKRDPMPATASPCRFSMVAWPM